MHIFNAANSEVETATATPSGGTFSTSNESELESGSYTAYATQASSLGNAEGKSEPRVSFTISTASPTVTLTGPATPSKNTKPTFSGKASDPTEPVVVHIFNAANSEVETATATPSGGAFSTSNESELESGSYTAYASQASSLGNAAGKSEPRVSFTISTASPTVTLTGPTTPSKNTKPTFSGKASDPTEPVVVHIFNAANSEVETATATPSGGTFSTSNESELESGSYTAYASQASSLGNAEGKSEPRVSFTISTASPTVTLTGPTTPSKNTKPTFSGKASDPTEPVVVHIFNAANSEVETATATPSGGTFSPATRANSKAAATPLRQPGELASATPQAKANHGSPLRSAPPPPPSRLPGLRRRRRTPKPPSTAKPATAPV